MTREKENLMAFAQGLESPLLKVVQKRDSFGIRTCSLFLAVGDVKHISGTYPNFSVIQM